MGRHEAMPLLAEVEVYRRCGYYDAAHVVRD